MGGGVGCVCSLVNYSVAYMKKPNKTESPIFPFDFYFTLLYLVLCRVAAVKVSPYIIIVRAIFYFFWDHFENQIPLKPSLLGVCSLANYSVAYEETQ